MLRTSPTLIILQLSIDVASSNKIGEVESGGNKTNLSNSSVSKKSTRAGYPNSKDVKDGNDNPNSASGNTKKGVKL